MQLIKTGRTALFAALLSLFMLAASSNMALASDVAIDFDDADKDYTADNPSDVYYIRGESHDHNLTVKGGTEDNPIVVHLQNLLLDMSDEDKSAVNVERGSYAKFVLDDGCTATLEGGARRGFAIDGYGRAALRTAGSHMTITGSGTLNAHGRDDSKNGTSGSDGGAGIGGSHNEGCGALVISDVDGAPTINAHGSGQAAAIGTGDDYKSGNGDAHWDENDSIVITGGTVDADVPEQDGAAIGTGRDSDLGSIKITGAPVVTAKTTHEDAAAIGAAYKGSVDSIEIDITGGSIVATAEGDDSAGIGTSDGSPKDDGRVGSISITTDPSRYVLSIGNATDAEAARIRDALAAQPLDAATPAGTAVVKIARRTAGAGGGGASTTYDLADYRLTPTRTPVQVAKRNVVISAADATGVYGGAEPVYALAYDADLPANRHADAGMASFDTVAGVFTTAPAVSGPDGFADLDAGTYEGEITVAGGESANYNVTFAPGTLTVAPASLRDASRVSVGQVEPVVYNGRAHTRKDRHADG